ncbi:MAG: hypothetical protein O7I93_05560 [Gemmatimonadetes bacterium]|nr:hypothetical protein [Gemmatimonadota bacterium]
MKKYLTSALAFSVLALAGCNDSLGPGNASEEDREDIVASLAEAGFFADEFGDDGVVQHVANYFDAAAAAAEPPRAWGRRHRVAVDREIRIEVDREAGLATVYRTIVFEGTFMYRNDLEEIVEKPMHHTLMQSAVFRYLEDARVNDHGRSTHWELIEVSPHDVVMTDPAERSVAIQSVSIEVNDVVVAEIVDAAERLSLAEELPMLNLGDAITVYATVANETNGLESETYVFLHLFHARTDRDGWRRLPMEYDPALDRWVGYWVVQQGGRERIVVDALDGGSWSPDGAYRAHVWGIPYHIEEVSDGV